jgi:hypothetical protein
MRKMQKAKNSQKENSQTAKSEIEWGYSENAASRGIYSPSGVPVRTVG